MMPSSIWWVFVWADRDIKQLDFAKRHLQTTITALKRLHMLVTAVDQLTFMANEKHYREAANLVDAVRQVRRRSPPHPLSISSFFFFVWLSLIGKKGDGNIITPEKGLSSSG